MAATETTKTIRTLARALGVQMEHHELDGTRKRASTAALRSVIAAFGLDIGAQGQLAGEALFQLEERRVAALIDHVHVVWDGEATPLRLTSRLAADAELVLTLETGDSQALRVDDAGDVHLPAGLPFGYHDIEITSGTATGRSRVICAPRHTHLGSHGSTWGLFVPLYAARREGDWGIGDLGSARGLLDLLDATGGGLLGSTPLLATFATEQPFEPSPYAPVSRLFWNEDYLDLATVPELQQTGDARDLMRDHEVLAERLRLNELPLVDHRAVHALKRRILELAAAELPITGARADAFPAWTSERAFLDDYARFRAALEAGDDAAELDLLAGAHYHRYVQFLMEEQLGALDAATHSGLYLDLPLGVHPDGFDRAHFDHLFTTGMSIGAPPDPLAAGGQNWGLPPLHPMRLREDGYRYVIAAMQHLFRHADAVRIDHVMGLHRLFWIPSELDASHGVYVSYEAEEQWAIVCLESNRAGCLVVGEDLGIVPDAVREAMVDHRAHRTYVMQFELDPAGASAIRPAPATALATIDTHDTQTFAAFWDQQPATVRLPVIELLRASGDLAITGSITQPLADDPPPERMHGAALQWLARGDATAVIANLEDFWAERDPQNVPGTGSHDAPNWVRRTARTLEQLQTDDALRRRLQRLTDIRNESATDMATTPLVSSVRHDVSMLTDDDLHLFNEGRHNQLHRKLGSHVREIEGVVGTTFALWAPNAASVSVIGDFNGWHHGSTPLAELSRQSGIWEGWVPGVAAGEHYKYHLVSAEGGYQVEKADPFARRAELPPKTASVVWADGDHTWGDTGWMEQRGAKNALDAPMSVYEMHVGSWMRVPEDGDRFLTYRELAPRLIDYLGRTGFTHVQFMPIMEHPFYGSWGYQTTGYFAPSTRYGSPDDLRALVDALHNAGYGVLLDWVPSHFPVDEHGLGFFDGTHLFEHADPRQGFHPDWKSWIFNYSRNEVRSFLLSSAL
ncbi:MAG: 4-alpha-glucanotransferase, partial [Thermoleophilia bacterium]|nr:4-alpha-glucanotransferase [Thermoleophilia bacterium]